MKEEQFLNPFRPGAGHMPPYLAGRESQLREFEKIADQDIILSNLIITGLRGVGKTVLLETIKPVAQAKGWVWVGSDLSESATLTEENLVTRILTDLAVITSDLVAARNAVPMIGFHGEQKVAEWKLDYPTLVSIYRDLPGLTTDKLKGILEIAWTAMSGHSNAKGIIFAYDEAQTMADHSDNDQYSLSVLLDSFQSLQRKGFPLLLILAGLPTIFPKLVEARIFAERMFRKVELNRLDDQASRDAILVPMAGFEAHPIVGFETNLNLIVSRSSGYPYFIQFICREAFDAASEAIHNWSKHRNLESAELLNDFLTIPIDAIINKLDSDFFAGRWARTTDRQRDLMIVIAALENCDTEFSVQEIVEQSKKLSSKPFTPSHVNQMLKALSESGLIYRNRHGKYSFAVPLMGEFIRRKIA